MQKIELKDFCDIKKWKTSVQDLCREDFLDIRISYESDFRNTKILRELSDDICKEFWISPKWRTRMVLIVDELNNNAIEYGSQSWDINYLDMCVKHDAWKILLSVAVTDSGTWDTAKTAKQMQMLQAEHEHKDFKAHHSIRGRGLFLIISRLVDTLSFEDDINGGLIVRVEKSLQESSEK